MTANDAIVAALKSAQRLAFMLTEDFTDAELLERPVPGANHLAWQLGHVICSEHRFLSNMSYPVPPLPEGFAEQHTAATASVDPPRGFFSRDVYRSTYTAVRAASISAVEKTPAEKFDVVNTGPTAAIAPTIGAVFLLIASHSTMHMAQATVVRRKLGKPILF